MKKLKLEMLTEVEAKILKLGAIIAISLSVIEAIADKTLYLVHKYFP